MNAISSIEPCAAVSSDWSEITQHVNAWRGRCTHLYTRAEAAVSDTLLVLSTVSSGQSLTMPHLVGQRFAALAKAVGSDGAFAQEGQAVTEALTTFRAHEGLRTYLCHGLATVTKDEKGHVYVIFSITPFQKGKDEKEMMIFDETRMAAEMQSLKRDGQRLEAALSKLLGLVRERHDAKI